MTAVLPLMKNLLRQLAKTVIIQLEVTSASAIDAATQKDIFGSCTLPYLVNTSNYKASTHFPVFGYLNQRLLSIAVTFFIYFTYVAGGLPLLVLP